MVLYDRLIRFLPQALRDAAAGADRDAIEELRLRAGRELAAVYPGGERSLGAVVSAEDVAHLVSAAAHGSLYAMGDSLKNGYITVDGGHRVGFCGTAVMKDGEICNLRELSSANIRVAREVKTAAESVMGLYQGSFESTLIIAPPGGGKTTLLRDLVRRLSDFGLRVGLVDERGEVAACRDGLPGLDVGRCTDVLTGCPKAAGLLTLTRAMNPQLLAVDEITSPEDAEALIACQGRGVRLLATVHGSEASQLEQNPIYRGLLRQGVFKCLITIGESRKISTERRY